VGKQRAKSFEEGAIDILNGETQKNAFDFAATAAENALPAAARSFSARNSTRLADPCWCSPTLASKRWSA